MPRLAVFATVLSLLLPGPGQADSIDEMVAFQYYQLALASLTRGDVAQAASRLEKATRHVPDWAQGQAMLGFARECAGDPAGAAQAYMKALEADSHCAFACHALRGLGKPATTSGEPCEGKGAYDLFRAGLRLLTEAKVDQGIRTVFSAAKASPGWVDVRNMLAYLYQEHRTKADAIRELRSVLEIAPKDFFARNALAELTPGVTQTSSPEPEHKGLQYPEWAGDDSNARYEQLLLEQVNAERRKRGLNELAQDGLLTKIAREHSGEMRAKKYFAHESPTPGRREPLDRYMLYADRKPQIIAENVARRWGSKPSLDEANIRRTHADLMDSPHHRENILRKGVTHVGIGVASNEKGDYWVTQVFARPR